MISEKARDNLKKIKMVRSAQLCIKTNENIEKNDGSTGRLESKEPISRKRKPLSHKTARQRLKRKRLIPGDWKDQIFSRSLYAFKAPSVS